MEKVVWMEYSYKSYNLTIDEILQKLTTQLKDKRNSLKNCMNYLQDTNTSSLQSQDPLLGL